MNEIGVLWNGRMVLLWENGSTRSEICLSQWRTQARRGELLGCSPSQIQISKETAVL